MCCTVEVGSMGFGIIIITGEGCSGVCCDCVSGFVWKQLLMMIALSSSSGKLIASTIFWLSSAFWGSCYLLVYSKRRCH